MYTTAEGTRLTGKRAYTAYRKDQQGYDVTPARAGATGGDSTPSRGGGGSSQKRPAANRSRGAQMTSVPRKAAATPRGGSVWNPQAPVTFDV